MTSALWLMSPKSTIAGDEAVLVGEGVVGRQVAVDDLRPERRPDRHDGRVEAVEHALDELAMGRSPDRSRGARGSGRRAGRPTASSAARPDGRSRATPDPRAPSSRPKRRARHRTARSAVDARPAGQHLVHAHVVVAVGAPTDAARRAAGSPASRLTHPGRARGWPAAGSDRRGCAWSTASASMSSVAGSSAALDTFMTASGRAVAVEQQERLVALAAEIAGAQRRRRSNVRRAMSMTLGRIERAGEQRRGRGPWSAHGSG